MHLGPEVLCQVTVDAELGHALIALERPRIGCGRGAEGLVDAHLVAMGRGSQMLSKVTLKRYIGRCT